MRDRPELGDTRALPHHLTAGLWGTAGAVISLSCAAPPSRCTRRNAAPGAASSVIRMARRSSERMPVVAVRMVLGAFLAHRRVCYFRSNSVGPGTTGAVQQ
jgi:hypothetical protein